MASLQLRLGGGAEKARLTEAPKPSFLIGDLARNERDAQQLAMGMLERRSRGPTGVDDRLCVADRRSPCMGLHAVADGGHGQARVLVVEVGPAAVVLGAEDEDLVHAAGGGLGEHGAEVLHPQRLVPLEGREQVRHHPHQPVPAGSVGLQRRRRGLLVARAEGALALRVRLHRPLPGDQLARTGGPLDGHRDPAPRQRVEAELAHVLATLPRR